MNRLLALLICCLTFSTIAQTHRINPHEFDCDHKGHSGFISTKDLTNDSNIDIKHYHLDLEIGIDAPYIAGNVSYILESLTDDLISFSLDLDSAFTIDSISSPVLEYAFENNEISLILEEEIDANELLEFAIYYHGEPVLAGGFKGLRYETHDGDEPIIASLSTPYLAHTWWPCKDGTFDKADSTRIDITIEDLIIDDQQLIAVSNGMLQETMDLEGKKKFSWFHDYPIVPYYVMVAISNYNHFDYIYETETGSFPLDYWVFNSHLSEAQTGLEDLPNVMDFFIETFGAYPFENEKYGMTQLGYYGGIENQTNSIVNNMSLGWFNVTVHELAHMWFADMITCQTWNHGWINEGFASYSEALYDEHANGFDSYQNYMVNYEFYEEGTLYLEDVSDPFNVFQGIIYDKGAYALHMLRGVMGDEDFFEALLYYSNNENIQYGHSTTEEFKIACETIENVDLDYFFDQWIYDERYPIYDYNFYYNESAEEVGLTIEQTQETLGWRSVFEMPIQIQLEFFDGTDSIIKIYNDAQLQNYHFTIDKEVQNIQLDPNKWILKNVNFDPEMEVGIEEREELQVQIFPNPSNGSFTVELGKQIMEKSYTLEIFDLSGKVISEDQRMQNAFSFQYNDLASGVYIIQVKTARETILKKVIIL